MQTENLVKGTSHLQYQKKKTDKKTKLGTKKFKVYVKETLELF